MTNHDAQKSYYLSSWKTFFFHVLGWSEPQVSEWIRKTGKDRLLEDYESWLYHDPPVVWAVEALLAQVLPEQLSSKAVTLVRNEILNGFAKEGYQVSPNSDWLLHRKRINHALKAYGVKLPQPAARSLMRQSFTEKTMVRGPGLTYASSLPHARTEQNWFRLNKPLHGISPMAALTRTKSSGLTVREFTGV